MWPGGVRRFQHWSPASRQHDLAECGWYPGGKDDYLAGYRAEFPDQAIIVVDDGIDILQAARERVQGLRTVHVDPWNAGPAELANTHENATDLFALLLKLQAMTRAFAR